MTDNWPIDSIAELRRLHLQLAEMDDGLTNNFQNSDSRGELNTELQALRKENSEFKKAQGAINRAILEDLGAIRKNVTDLKIKLHQNNFDNVNQSALNNVVSICRHSCLNENQTSERPIVEEIIGTWEYIGNFFNIQVPIDARIRSHGQPVQCPTGPLIFKDISLRGFWMSRWYDDQKTPEKRLQMYAELGEWMKSGEMQKQEFVRNQLQDHAKALDEAQTKFDKKQLFVME